MNTKKNEKDKEHCDFKIKKFNLTKRPKGYGKRKYNDENLTYPVELEKAPPTKPEKGKKPVKTTTTTTTNSGSTTSSTTQASSGQAVIFLDFDGGTVSNTSWNYAGDIVAAPANLVLVEQEAIVNNAIMDYSPFNVTVTKDESVYNAAPANKRVRCIITESHEWYGSNAGGVAYTGSWNWGDGTPCWVFSTLLGYNTKNIQEAVSHEIGHMFGLRHQASWDANCVLTSSYNYGCCGEAPIMGVGYYQPDVHWWVGPNNLDCNSVQDDAAILASKLGLK